MKNIELRTSNITDLNSFTDKSVDAVISNDALHHLPDVKDLGRTFSEINRILNPNGGLYLVDLYYYKHIKPLKKTLKSKKLFSKLILFNGY